MATNDGNLDELKLAWETARKRAKTERTAEAREAAKAAWAALEAAAPKRKVSGYASRAGKKQQQIRRATEGNRR